MKRLIIILVWWIASTQCWDGMLYNVWTNGHGRIWLPKLTVSGEWLHCNK